MVGSATVLRLARRHPEILVQGNLSCRRCGHPLVIDLSMPQMAYCVNMGPANHHPLRVHYLSRYVARLKFKKLKATYDNTSTEVT